VAKNKAELKARLTIDRKIDGLAELKKTLKKEFSGFQKIQVKLSTNRAIANLKKLKTHAESASASLGKTFSSQHVANIGRTGQAIRKTSNNLKGFSKSTVLATKRYAAFVLGAGSSVVVFRRLIQQLRSVVEFETSLVKIAQVSGTTLLQMGNLGDAIRQVAIEFGTSSQEIADSSLILKQAGLNFNQIESSLETLAKIQLSPTFGDLRQATEGIVVLQSVFGQSLADLKTSG